MENHMHSIDKYGGTWSDEDLEKFFLFCLLNRNITYIKLCDIFDWMIESYWKGTFERTFGNLSEESVARALKWFGHRFPNQTAKFIKENDWITASFLKHCTRKMMVEKCKGIGMKLASMYLRNTRCEEYAVLDVHVKRFLEQGGFNPNGNYLELEEIFGNIAKRAGMTMFELDMTIWQNYRVGAKEPLSPDQNTEQNYEKE